MPRTKTGSPPSYRLHKPSGQAIVSIDGRDYYLGVFGTPASRQRYTALIRAWEKRREERNSAPPGPAVPLSPDTSLTLNDLVLGYLRHVKDYYTSKDGQKKEAGCIADALDVLQRLYGREPAGGFGPKKLKEVRTGMIARGWCRQYINHQVSRVKRMFAWAVEEELIPGSVHHALRVVKGLKKGKLAVPEGKKVRPLSPDLIKPVVAKAHEVLAAMIRFQHLTGCRSCELCALKPCYLDRTSKVWVYSVPPEANKTEHLDQERKIYIGPRTQRVLTPLLEAIGPDEHVFSPARAEALRQKKRRETRKTPLWPSHLARLDRKRKENPGRRKRDHYDTASYRRAVKRACLAASVEPWHPHRLRHTAATRFRKKCGLEVARILLGHKKIGVTELYAEQDVTKARKVARTLA